MRAVLIILAPILLGLVLRLIGIEHGEDRHIFHPDVPKQAWMAIKIYSGVPSPIGVFKYDYELELYPYGTATIIGYAGRWVGDIRGMDLHHQTLWRWVLALRGFSVLAAIGSLLLLLGVLHRAFGALPALITGIMLAVEPLHVQLSHYGMNDVPMISMLLVTWLLAAATYRDVRGLAIYSLAGGFTLGLAFGFKYQAIFGAVFLASAWIAYGHRNGWTWLLRSMASSALGALAGLAVSCPMLIQEPSYFFERFPKFMMWQANISNLDLSTWEKLSDNVPNILLAFVGQGRWLLLAPAAWTVLHTFRYKTEPVERCLIGSALTFCVLLSATMAVSRDLIRANDVVALFPFLILAAGWAASRIPRAKWRVAALSACVVYSVVSASTALRDSIALTRRDTRLKALDWCNANIPDGSVVRREGYTLKPSKRVVDREYRYLANPEIQHMIDKGQFDYLIVSSLAHARFFDPFFHGASESAREFYRRLPERFTEVASFSDRELLYAHPVIRIYRRSAPPN